MFNRRIEPDLSKQVYTIIQRDLETVKVFMFLTQIVVLKTQKCKKQFLQE